jgi:hypothetical protein
VQDAARESGTARSIRSVTSRRAGATADEPAVTPADSVTTATSGALSPPPPYSLVIKVFVW